MQKIKKLNEKNTFKVSNQRASPADSKFGKTSILEVKTYEFGYHVVEDCCTLLPIMGMDIERLAYQHLNRDFELINKSVI